MENSSPKKVNHMLPRTSRHYTKSDSDGDLNEESGLGDIHSDDSSPGSIGEESFPYYRLHNRNTHDSGNFHLVSTSPPETSKGMYFDYCPLSSQDGLTEQEVNESQKLKNDLGCDECLNVEQDASSVESTRDMDVELESVRVDYQYGDDVEPPMREMKTFRTYPAGKVMTGRRVNNEHYDEVVDLEDPEEVSLNGVTPHRELYRNTHNFTPMDAEDGEDYLRAKSYGTAYYSRSPQPVQEVDQFVRLGLKDGQTRRDYGATASRGVRIQNETLLRKSPPFGLPPQNKEALLLPASKLISSTRGCLEEGQAGIFTDDNSAGKKKKKRKGKDDSGGEFDINGNPREGNFDTRSEARLQKSSYPSSLSDTHKYLNASKSSSGETSHLHSTSCDSGDKNKKKNKNKDKNVKNEVKADKVPGYRGNENVDDLLDFIENNSNKKNKKKVATSPQTNGPQNGPTKTAVKKSKKNKANLLKSEYEDISGKDNRKAVSDGLWLSDDTASVITAVDEDAVRHVRAVEQYLQDNRLLQKPTEPGAVEAMVPAQPAAQSAPANQISKSLPATSIAEVLEAGTDTKANSTSSQETLQVADMHSCDKSSVKAGTPDSQGPKLAASRERIHSDSYKFTDFIVAPKEEEFTVVSKKKKHPQPVRKSAVNPSGFPYSNSTPSFQNNFPNKEHVSRDTRRYSPPQIRSITPPPMSVSSPVQPEKPTERAFSPSAFPVLGGREGRRNSTGNVPAELNPDADSDLESVKSLPLGNPGAAYDGAMSPPSSTMSYAKIAAQPRGGKPGAPAATQVPNAAPTGEADTNVLSKKSPTTDSEAGQLLEDMADQGEDSSRQSSAAADTSLQTAGTVMPVNDTEGPVHSDTKCECVAEAAVCESQLPPTDAPTTHIATHAPKTANHKRHRLKGVVFVNREGIAMTPVSGISFGFEEPAALLGPVPSNGLPVLASTVTKPTSMAVRTSPGVEAPVKLPTDPAGAENMAGSHSATKTGAPLRQNIFPPSITPSIALTNITFGFEEDLQIESPDSGMEDAQQGARMPPDGAEGQCAAEDCGMPAGEVSVPEAEEDRDSAVCTEPECTSTPSTPSEASVSSSSGERTQRTQRRPVSMTMAPPLLPGKALLPNGLLLPQAMHAQGAPMFANPQTPLLNPFMAAGLQFGSVDPSVYHRPQQFPPTMPPYLQRAHPQHPPPFMMIPPPHMAMMGQPPPPIPHMMPPTLPMHMPQPSMNIPPPTANTPPHPPAVVTPTTPQSDPAVIEAKPEPPASAADNTDIPAGVAWLPNLRREEDPNFVRGKFQVIDAVAYLNREWDRTMELKQKDPGRVQYYSST